MFWMRSNVVSVARERNPNGKASMSMIRSLDTTYRSLPQFSQFHQNQPSPGRRNTAMMAMTPPGRSVQERRKARASTRMKRKRAGVQILARRRIQCFRQTVRSPSLFWIQNQRPRVARKVCCKIPGPDGAEGTPSGRGIAGRGTTGRMLEPMLCSNLSRMTWRVSRRSPALCRATCSNILDWTCSGSPR